MNKILSTVNLILERWLLKTELLFFNSFIPLLFEVLGEPWVFFCLWTDPDGAIDDVFKSAGGLPPYPCVATYPDDVFGAVDCIH